MGLQIISRQLIARTAGVDHDEVIAFVPLPTGSKLNNVWLDVSVVGGATTVAGGCMYGVSGFVTDVDDPDTAILYDTLWDAVIQKDQPFSHEMIDDVPGGLFDTSVVDERPEFEVGEFDLEAIFGTELLGNMEIFRRRELLTFPKKPAGFYTVGTDPVVGWYTPVDSFKTHIKGGPTVQSPSVAMFGFSSPAMDRTKAQISWTPSEKEWIMTQYAEVFLYDMWKYLMGMAAASGEYPNNRASNWFAELLEDYMIEDANYIIPNSYVVTTKVTWDITVPGKPGSMVLTSE